LGLVVCKVMYLIICNDSSCCLAVGQINAEMKGTDPVKYNNWKVAYIWVI